jgi:uncharacterized protein (TIGR02996 family)
MNEQQAFLQAILETPDDDAPRLVYADWLEDHQQSERAEFIRVQCQLEKMDADEEQRSELKWRESELLRLHGEAWGKPFVKFTRRIEFLRGFVGRMTLTAEKFLKSAGDIFARVPLRRLRLLQVESKSDELAVFEPLSRLRALDVHSCRLGQARTVKLMGCPHLVNLEELNLGHVHTRLSGARAVCNSPHLRQLRTLNLEHNLLDDSIADLLADSRSVRQLGRLSLAGNQISGSGVESLGRTEHLRGLTDLDLRDNPFGDGAANRLAASDQWGNLRRLSLSGSGLMREGIRALAGCPHLANLRELYLANLLNGLGLRELADSPHLVHLRVLDLNLNPPTDEEEVRALVGSSLLPRLRALCLPRLNLAGARLLLRSPASAGLERLSFCGHIGSALGEEIAAANHLTRLTDLELRGVQLRSAGLRALVNSPHLSRLSSLEVPWNHITEEGYQALVRSPHLVRLRRINLYGNPRPSPATIDALAERFGEQACRF